TCNSRGAGCVWGAPRNARPGRKHWCAIWHMERVGRWNRGAGGVRIWKQRQSRYLACDCEVKCRMPAPTHDIVTTVVKGKVYVFGGLLRPQTLRQAQKRPVGFQQIGHGRTIQRCWGQWKELTVEDHAIFRGCGPRKFLRSESA